MAINLTDSLNAATTKGKLGDAKQVYLNGDTKNLQQAHEETNAHLDTLDNRSSQMEEAIQDISATGGASTANAVSYDNSTSELEAVTAQGALDETSSIKHFAKRGSVINISTNYNSLGTAEVLTLEQAIAKVPASDRTLGFIGTFLTSDGWVKYQFTGNSLTDWSNISKWYNYIVTKDIVQQRGTSVTTLMSQKAVTDELNLIAVFDISEYNLTDGKPTKYADFAAALGTNGANVPELFRRGGMTVKYVQSSDNKYVQYRLMADSWSTNVSDWQGVDDGPIAGSENLVKSGGIGKYSLVNGIQYVTPAGSAYYTMTNESWYGTKIRCIKGSVFSIAGKGGSAVKLWATLDRNGIVLRVSDGSLDTRNNPVDITIQDNEEFIVMNTSTVDSFILLKNTAEVISEVKTEYNSLEAYKNFKSTFCVWGYLQVLNNDEAVIIVSSGYKCTDFIQIDANDTINYNIYHSTSGGTSEKPLIIGGGIYCFDKYRNYIGIYTITHASYMMKGTVTLPDLPSGTVYIRMFAKEGTEYYIYGVRDNISVIESKYSVLYPKDNYPVVVNLPSSTSINDALEELHTLGGGTLHLGDRTINGIAININYDDVRLEGNGVNNTIIKGPTPNLILGDGVTNASVSNISFSTSYRCKKSQQLVLDNCKFRNTMYNGIAKSVYYIASSDSTNNLKLISDVVIDVSENAESVINNALNNYDIVYMMTGTYNTTSAITLNSGNKLIRYGGAFYGRCTINRSTNGYVLTSADNANDIYIEGMYCNKKIAVTKGNAHNSRVVDTFFDIESGGRKITDFTFGVAGETEMRCGVDFPLFTTALKLATLEVPDDVRYVIGIYGVIDETITSTIQILNSVHIEGKTPDSEIRLTYNSASSAVLFRDYNAENHSVVKNVKFSMYGTAGGYQFATVIVKSNFCYFENCKFLNYQNCASSYDPELDTGNSPLAGDRKHGCLIQIEDSTNVYDENCHLEFHNCLAVGSPYGHKNCRGWYIVKGSPKLYNCKGIGGGVGRYGYGFVCHHSSKPYLYNCIGIGSPYGWEFASGINFQMSTEAKLFNCIGIGGTGYKHKSSGNGVIVRQDEITGASHGFGFLMNVKPTLVNCMGYAGDGEGSFGLYATSLCKPDIVGGVFGKDAKIYCVPFTKDSGKDYMTLSIGNDYRNIELVSVGFRDLSGMVSGQKIVFKNGDGDIILEASEITQQQYATISDKYIMANDTITCHVVDANGDDVTSTVNFDIIVQYMVSNRMSCVGMVLTASPHIHKALFKGNDEADGISIETTTNDYLIEDCTVEIASTRYPVKSSTQRSDVNVVGCLFTSALDDENILSYMSVTQKGSNSVVS